jgi:flagellar protein FlbT
MSHTLKITLKANEKIYVNGAVIRADRKVSLEFMNDVQFLLENHVMQADEASTPLRQLYFITQIMLMNPGDTQEPRRLFREMLPRLLDAYADAQILSTLKHVDALIGNDRAYEALRALRSLFAAEAAILNPPAEEPARPLALLAGE